MMANHITFLGDDSRTGAYILWLNVRAKVAVTFGRFQGGRPVHVPAGTVAYVGSAMGTQGATALAGRLLRHATRTGERPPHAIRAALFDALQNAGMGAPEIRPPHAKRLHWHIDYLLDENEAEIIHVTAIRTAARLESALARRLAALPGVVPLAPGLGASDARGQTHLLHYADRDTPQRMAMIITDLVASAV